MFGRINSILRAIARPALIATAVLMVGGSALAATGIAEGWIAYLAGYASLAVTMPALAAAHHDRLGRFAKVAFGLATINAVLGTPVVAMVASFVLGLDALHLALMPYAMSLVGMAAALGINISIAIVGLAIVRARVFRPVVGWLMVAAALVEYPVELGLAPLPLWTLAMAILAVAFLVMARSLVGSVAVVEQPRLAGATSA